MVTFVLCVAILNVGVGFVFAGYLGRRYRHLLALEIDSSQSSFVGAELYPPLPPDSLARPMAEAATEGSSAAPVTAEAAPVTAEVASRIVDSASPAAAVSEASEPTQEPPCPTEAVVTPRPERIPEGTWSEDAGARVERTAIYETPAATAAVRQPPPPRDDARLMDPLTGLANRAGLEAALAGFWNSDERRQRQLCVVMFDLDQFGRINEQHGPLTGDRILHALAQVLRREGAHSQVTARVSGQQFVMLFPDVDLCFTTSAAERIRQTVEISRFECQNDEIRLTVSCAVVEAAPREDLSTLLARTEAAIQEAKRYGRNRTFLHEGKYPTPVVPPDFTLGEKSISL